MFVILTYKYDEMEKQTKIFGTEDKPLLSIQRARELLNDTTSTDEELEQLLLTIQQFTEMVYQLYQMDQQAATGSGGKIGAYFDDTLENAA